MGDKSQFRIIQDYLTEFIANIRENDPLPVRAPSYEVPESEIDGQILDIVYHYLNHRECHPYIRHLVAHQVWNKMRNSDGDDIDGPMHNRQPYYEPLKLIKEVTKIANSAMKDILCTLSPSVTDTVLQYLPISHYCIKNSRRKMEDRCVILQDLNTLYDMKFGYPHAYYGVFDGHCSADGAVYAAAHLHQFLIQNPLYSTNLEAAMKHAFHICDTNFIRHSKTERLKGGTTAVVALVRENKLVVAWLGDSQALLVRKRMAAHVGEPHTPSRECERKRIDDMGGAVLDIGGTWRVLGQLAVSRAIGDADYKPYISSECDIKSLEISGDEDFLILACDGLWDTLSPKQAVNLVYAYLTQNDGDTDGVGKCLVEAARLAGSEDNITAVVVFLRPVTTLMEEEHIRVEKGEVTDVGQVIPVSKDSQPTFIMNLFTQPLPSPFEEAAKVEHNLCTNNQLSTHEQPPFDEPEPDYDIDNVENDVIPTDEEVDAVLAELDSIPDAPEDNEDSSDDDGQWTYAKIEPRMQAQIDDILPETAFTQDTNVNESLVDPPMTFENLQTDEPFVAPQKSNSLRSVEGFITSIELNASQDTFPADLSVNQVPDIDQTSGPFSIYVSSSPEPASIEVVVQTQASIIPPTAQDAVNGQEDTVSEDISSVEIIHAQSTIEVTPNTLQEEEVPTENIIPDIMTQSFAGQIPTEPFEFYQPPVQLEDERVDDNLSSQININKYEEDYLLVGELATETTNKIDGAESTVLLEYDEPPSHVQILPDHSEIVAPTSDRPVVSAVDTVETIQTQVNNSHFNEEIDILYDPSKFNNTTEPTANLVEEVGSISAQNNNSSDVNQAEEITPITQIKDILLHRKKENEIHIPPSNIVAESEADIAPIKIVAESEADIVPIKIVAESEADIAPIKIVAESEADIAPIKIAAESEADISPIKIVAESEADISPSNIIAENEDKHEQNITVMPIKAAEVLPIPTKRGTASSQVKKSLKDAPKPSPRTPAKIERTTQRKLAPTKEPSKPQTKKDIGIVKKTTATKIISKSTTSKLPPMTLGVAKPATTTAKSVPAPKLVAKSPATKQSEKSLHATNRPASSIAKKPLPNLPSKAKGVTKSPAEKAPLATKATTMLPPRRPQPTPRPTSTSTARSSAVPSSCSAAFAAPTKDSKNTANKLLSSKITASSTANRTKVLSKPTRITQKQMPTSKPTAGMKMKAVNKTAENVKAKEELLTNGSSKEKESCVEKFDEKKEMLNGAPLAQ